MLLFGHSPLWEFCQLIHIGNFNETEEDMQQAIYSAHLQDMIKELPNGLDTMLGEQNLTLSGGRNE